MDNSNNAIEIAGDKIVKIKSNQSFNESSLMTLPFISLKRNKVTNIKRKWIRGNEEVGLEVRGSADNGCPTIYELDVLMALFKIHARNMENKIEISGVVSGENKRTYTVTNMPKVINFTYRGLAKEMGLKGFGKATKNRLERSIMCLTECTVYSTFAFRDAKIGEYVADFNGMQNCRILINYRTYQVSNFKRAGKKLLSADQILEMQSVEIDDFLFDNLCNNYFKLYDYEKYKQLTKGIAKKLLLILTQWSNGFEKFISYQVLYDYIGIDTEDYSYYKYKINEAVEELMLIKFIRGFETRKDGVNFVFNTTAKLKAQNLHKYCNGNEVLARLREIGVSYDDILKYCYPEALYYVSALLRYADFREAQKSIDDILKFVQAGLPINRYNVEKFMVKI